MQRSTIRRSARAVAFGAGGLCLATFVSALGVGSSSAAPEPGVAMVADGDPVPGSQGTDTALPLTDSAVTIKGRDKFADLTITVNQTKFLTNQAISVTWSGGQPTIQGPGRFAGNFLQIFQCWGDDDGTNPANPGPPPQQCEQGAYGITYDGLPPGLAPNASAILRAISRTDWPSYDPAIGYTDTKTNDVWMPFKAVDGTVINVPINQAFNPGKPNGTYWQNPYFDSVTTNEIAGAATGVDGTGEELFQVVTGIESTGLGCGQKVLKAAGADPKIPKCWLVIVPRGLPADEDVGTSFEGAANQVGVNTSPLSPNSWKNRIAIPLEFNPVDTPCKLADDERRIAGNELVLPAVVSWQPALCSGGTLPPYAYALVGDSAARQVLSFAEPGSPGLVAVSRPIDPAMVSADKPVVYAPLSASGLVIGFNVERWPLLSAPQAEQDLAGIRIRNINLTPRLVAKLLTQSYRQQVDIIEPSKYTWSRENPLHLGKDPDFLRFNSEFKLLDIAEGRTFGGLQLPAANSDAAKQLWEYVLADPEAKAWLDGAPDEWGMKVNPVYATKADVNSAGIAFGDPTPESFAKADPYCYQAPALPTGLVPNAVCGTDWLPYTRSLSDGAIVTRAAADRPRIVPNPSALVPSDAWKRDQPQILGRRAILSFTDTASAARYGLQVASLSRAGDNAADRAFVAPDSAGLNAAVAAMVPSDEPTVRILKATETPAGAYPLTTLTYAAVSPLALDDTARSEYAAFIEYAAGAGQVPGFQLGQLPVGYVPLPDVLKQQAVTAAAAVRTLQPPPEETTTTTVAPTTPTTRRVRPNGNSSGGTTFTDPTTPPPATSPPETTVPVAATTVPETVAPESTVAAAAEPAGVSRPLTPTTKPTINRFAVPVAFALMLLAALAALEITKRPRAAAPTAKASSK